VQRYEQLRARVLAGEPSGWRLGLVLLQRRGLAAWTRAWPASAPATLAPAAANAVPARAGDQEIVEVLAGMALACAAGR
jgi:hypothetical protein